MSGDSLNLYREGGAWRFELEHEGKWYVLGFDPARDEPRVATYERGPIDGRGFVCTINLDTIEALTREVEGLRLSLTIKEGEWDNASRLATALKARAEAAEARALAAEQRLAFLEQRAHQNTAYDVFGNGGNWHVAVHSDDNHLSFIAAIDAAISAKRGEGES